MAYRYSQGLEPGAAIPRARIDGPFTPSPDLCAHARQTAEAHWAEKPTGSRATDFEHPASGPARAAAAHVAPNLVGALRASACPSPPTQREEQQCGSTASS